MNQMMKTYDCSSGYAVKNRRNIPQYSSDPLLIACQHIYQQDIPNDRAGKSIKQKCLDWSLSYSSWEGNIDSNGR
jgi:hypothetical protein